MTIRDIHLRWDDSFGECYDCGLPAAFLADYYAQGFRDATKWERLCAICAANAAVNGHKIERIGATADE